MALPEPKKLKMSTVFKRAAEMVVNRNQSTNYFGQNHIYSCYAVKAAIYGLSYEQYIHLDHNFRVHDTDGLVGYTIKVYSDIFKPIYLQDLECWWEGPAEECNNQRVIALLLAYRVCKSLGL